MNRIRRIVKEHQLISFFALSYLTTWLLVLPFFLTGDEQTIIGILVLVGIFGPAFANIIISRIIAPVSNENPRRRRHITFLVTWVIATVIFTLYVHTTSEIESPFALVFYAIVGLLPAFVMASAFSKYPVVRRSLSSIVNPKGHMGWYLFALLMPPVIKLISIPITKQLGGVIYEPYRVYDISRLLGLVAISFLYGLVFTGGLNEETGWTGFALPRLQVRHSPLIASIVLWFFWVLWHIPMKIVGYWNPDVESFIRAVIGMFFARFIFTWLYNKTKGGILTAILFHASANASFSFLPATYIQRILEAILAVFIVFIARMWEKLPDDNPAMYRRTVKNA